MVDSYLQQQARRYGMPVAQYAAFKERHDRIRNHKERERMNLPMKNATDIINVIKQAPQRLANIYSTYVQQAEAVESNDLIWPQGRFMEVARLREAAVEAALAVQDNIAVASNVAKKALEHQRDQLKPKVDNATHERKARQLTYLVDRGVPLEDLISENVTDSITLRILEQELPVLSRGRQPQDKESGRTFDELLHQAARATYGEEFKAADDKLSEVERGAYRANVAAAQTIRALREDDRPGLVAPAWEDGQLIEVA